MSKAPLRRGFFMGLMFAGQAVFRACPGFSFRHPGRVPLASVLKETKDSPSRQGRHQVVHARPAHTEALIRRLSMTPRTTPMALFALQDDIARDFLAASRVHPACGGKPMLSANPTSSPVNRSDRYPSPASPG
ncbi:putative dioxygenase [Pseudomonas aeruginosa]|nr:putative dioxygenase [Pseudomonas aeruginosa]